MATIFTRVVNGEIPCYKIAETADYLAFLDVRPQMRGHALVIPKKEVDYIFDLEDDADLYFSRGNAQKASPQHRQKLAQRRKLQRASRKRNRL